MTMCAMGCRVLKWSHSYKVETLLLAQDWYLVKITSQKGSARHWTCNGNYIKDNRAQ